MRLFLFRLPSSHDTTIGRLYSLGPSGLVGVCFVLEDVVREIAGQPVETWKIPKRTAIPAGTYEIIITMSARFKRPLPLLLNVRGFSGIRIHPGNRDVDTEGCLLAGFLASGDASDDVAILNSRLACEHAQGLIGTALNSSQRVTIEIRNAPSAVTA